ESLLLNILPGSIAERLKANPQTIADHFTAASVLFADVVDFTPRSERLPPAEVVGMLDRLFSHFDTLAERYGLEKIKTIGDCYMVASGVPTSRPDHARALALLALDMVDATRPSGAVGDLGFELRVGINSGPVVAVVIGGTGLIGSKVVAKLTERGHEAIPASPRLGINTLTGEGVAAALDGASVVVDVSNSPNFEYATALEFFQASTRNLLAADAAAGVGHHVALSVVGTKALSEGGDPATTTAGYFRAKLAPEAMIQASSIPYSIVHATQFFEFIKSIADDATD